MSYLDPYGSTGPRSQDRPDEPRGWERPGEPRGWERPGEPRGWERPGEPRGWERPDEPRGWERPDEPRGWGQRDGPPGQPWSGRGEEPWPRARHAGAAPDAYVQPSSHEPARPYGSDPAQGNSHGSARGGYWWRDENAPVYPRPGDAGSSAEAETAGWPLVPPDPAAHRSHGPGDAFGDGATNAEAETAGWPLVPADAPPRGRRQRGRRRAGARRTANQPPPSGRAGRNLPAAIGVGVFLAAAILVPLFLFRPAFFGVVALAVGVGIWEMTRAVRASGAHPPMMPLIAGGVLMVGLAWRAGPDGLSLGLLVTVLATTVWRLADGPAGYQRDLTAATLIAVYVPFLGGFAALLAVPPDGDWRVLVTLAAVVLSDTGGYAAGVFLGKHPMAPSVSPKKSWEGFAGSVVAAAVGSAALLFVLFDVGLVWGALFGLAVSIAAVLGDLGESMIKRDLGIKDMSNLLPGHGGLMDRLDSILFAVPTAYLLLAIFAPGG